MQESDNNAGAIPVLMMTRELSGLGGIERDVSKLARYLPRYGFAPHVAYFVRGGERLQEIEAAGIPTLHLPVHSFKSRSALYGAQALRRYIKERSILVVHAFDAPTVIYGVPLARLFQVPVVLASQLWLRDFMSRPTQQLLGITDRLAHGVVVNCKAAANELTSVWNVPANRIHLCYNGLETGEFNPRDRRRPEQLRDASIVVGTVAALRKEKNLPILIEAFAQLHSIDPKAYLLIVGSGVMKPTLLQMAVKFGLLDRCVFVDSTPHPADWMRSIDIFVLPSNSEAFSNALLEAMGCGCCPVGSRVGGTPELIEHGVRGLLFDRDNAKQLAEHLCYLARNEGTRKAMAERAAAFAARELNIDNAAARLAGIYRQLLEQRGVNLPLEASGSNSLSVEQKDVKESKIC